MQTILRVKHLCLCLFAAALFSMPVLAQADVQTPSEHSGECESNRYQYC